MRKGYLKMNDSIEDNIPFGKNWEDAIMRTNKKHLTEFLKTILINNFILKEKLLKSINHIWELTNNTSEQTATICNELAREHDEIISDILGESEVLLDIIIDEFFE